MSSAEKFEESKPNWSAANRQYLEAELGRLRLLVQRRVLWLRKLWKRELAPELQNFQGLVITDAEADLLLGSKGEAAEQRFYEEDEEAREIARKLAEQQLLIRDAVQGIAAAEGPPALEILARLFRLGDFERDVVLLCLAPEIDPGFERLYAYVQDDATRKYPTPSLAVQVLGGCHYGDVVISWERCAAAFAPDASLRRFHLIHNDASPHGSWGSESLRLDRRIGSYLLGVNFLDEQSAAFLRPVAEAVPLSREQQKSATQLQQRLRAWNDRDRMPAINLTGKDGGAFKAMARELCASLGVALYEIDISRLPATAAERQACCRIFERESLLLPCAYYVDCSELDHANRSETAQILELVKVLRAFLLVGSREPLSSERTFITLRVPRNDPQAQLAVWQGYLEEMPSSNGAVNQFLAKMVQQFQFSPQQIHRVVRTAYEDAALRSPESPTPCEADLWLAARGHAVRSIEGLAEKIECKRPFDDLVLPAEALQQIREIASQVEQRNRVYEQWGFSAKLSRGRGISALFAGPSGTGKTMAAEVLAGHLQLDLYRIDLANVISKYIGETEKNLKRVFDAAEESGAILFFDEADALFGKRSEVRDSHDRYANIEINYLLQRMEDYRGLAILATNRKSLLDQAFLRRLRFLVDFPFPSAADRVRIWHGAFPKQANVGPLDFACLGRLEIAGGNICNIALNAAFLAANANSSINMEHILTAARREYAKIDKLVLESEFGRYYTAVHP
jgi:hypothetical protein